MKRISITVPDEAYNFIRSYSRENNRTVSNQIVTLIRKEQEARSCQQKEINK